MINCTILTGYEVIYTGERDILEGIFYVYNDEMFVLHNNPNRVGCSPPTNEYTSRYKYGWSLGDIDNFHHYLNEVLFIKSPSCLFVRTGQTISDGTTTYFVVQAFDYVLALRTNDGIILREREELETNGFTILSENT